MRHKLTRTLLQLLGDTLKKLRNAPGLLGRLASAALQRIVGTSSRMNSTILAEVSAVRHVLPVKFPLAGRGS
jgi:hypothetical protein